MTEWNACKPVQPFIDFFHLLSILPHLFISEMFAFFFKLKKKNGKKELSLIESPTIVITNENEILWRRWSPLKMLESFCNATFQMECQFCQTQTTLFVSNIPFSRFMARESHISRAVRCCSVFNWTNANPKLRKWDTNQKRIVMFAVN